VHGGRRQTNDEAGAAGLAALDRDRPFVLLDNRVHQGKPGPVPASFVVKNGSKIRSRARSATPTTIDSFGDDALASLASYGWPGNVRELEYAVERAVVICKKGQIGVASR
jgi:hypothetical protein